MELQAASLAARGAAASPLRFLVVDDDPVHRMVIGKVGEKAGYSVTTAATVDDAAEKLAEKKFDCISLDAALAAVQDGHVLRGIVRNHGNVLLFVVSRSAAEMRQETINDRPDLRLTVVELPKPVDLATLRTRLTGHATLTRGPGAHRHILA